MLTLHAAQLVNDNILHWKLGLIVVNSDSAFNGGYFKVSANYDISRWRGWVVANAYRQVRPK